MPRSSQPSQKAGTSRKKQNQSQSQTTIQQSSSRSQPQKMVENIEDSQPSQKAGAISKRQNQSQSQTIVENIDKLLSNCVRFIIYRAGSNLPIRKADIQKNVLKNVGQRFDQILAKVTETLKNVYGYDLYLSEDGGCNKQYLVSNTLPYKDVTENVQTESDEDIAPNVHKILIMLVLTHIFMSNNNVSEAALFAFLQTIEIDPDKRHELFGNVKDFITSTMVKQKYLSTELDQFTRRVSYLWGPRAQHEISKHEILKFVCKIYKDRTPKSWASQFKSANAQSNENGNAQNDAEAADAERSG